MVRSTTKYTKPLMLIGNGVRQAGAAKKLNRILKKIQIPVLTTWRAADIIDSDYELNFGRPGLIGQRAANFILQKCDMLVCLGTRLDLPQVGFDYRNFAPNAEKYVIDIDIEELWKLPRVGYTPIHCDVSRALDELDIAYDSNSYIFSAWIEDCKRLQKEYSMEKELQRAKDLNIDVSIYERLLQISRLCKDTTVVLGSSGSIAEIFFQIAEFQPGMRVINSPGLGSMGFALPAAIGAYHATQKPVVCIDGDGSFAMNVQELSVVAGEHLPIAIFIINNNGYASIRNTQNNLNMDKLGSDCYKELRLPYYDKVAKAFNLDSKFVHYDMDFPKTIEYPKVYEVFVSRYQQTICRTKTTKQPDGSLKASALEDLWPFLDKEEIENALY